MTPRQSLYPVRKSWSLIVAGVVLGLGVGWITAPGTATGTTAFEATHTLIFEPTATLEQKKDAILRGRLGAVPDRVAARLAIDPLRARSSVSIETPTDQGALLITGQSADPAQAEALANITAEELVTELGGPLAPLHTLEPAVASPIDTGDPQGPGSRPSRALLLGGFGLLLGIGAAFVLDRFDSRLQSKGAAEDALGLPVMAEVPALPRSDREQIVDGSQPSAFIEAYRGLRTSVDRWRSQAENGDGKSVLVVISPIGGEGATTTVAHLAAALGEVGRTVMVMSADLRHPSLHLYFNKAPEPGLTDVLRGAPDARRLLDLNLATTVRGVRFVASGAPVRNPAPLLDHIGDHLRDARSMADIVLVDAPPLLTTSDGADLARHADGVLVVVRAGYTSIRAARGSTELLRRLEIPIVGAVLVAAQDQ
jgi:succinoglycan biosynthesis transport protein ExoP